MDISILNQITNAAKPFMTKRDVGKFRESMKGTRGPNWEGAFSQCRNIPIEALANIPSLSSKERTLVDRMFKDLAGKTPAKSGDPVALLKSATMEEVMSKPMWPNEAPLDNQVGGDHYKKMAVQPAYYNWANKIPFIEGCCIKYLSRWRDKGGVDDLRKVIHFVELLIYFETTPIVLIEQRKIDELEATLNAEASFNPLGG